VCVVMCVSRGCVSGTRERGWNGTECVRMSERASKQEGERDKTETDRDR